MGWKSIEFPSIYLSIYLSNVVYSNLFCYTNCIHIYLSMNHLPVKLVYSCLSNLIYHIKLCLFIHIYLSTPSVIYLSIHLSNAAQSSWAAGYIDCTSAAGWHPPPNECSVYDTKQSDVKVPKLLELRGMQGDIPSLLLLPGPLWPGEVAPDRVLSKRQIQLNCVLVLNWIAWNRSVLTFKLRIHAKLNCSK